MGLVLLDGVRNSLTALDTATISTLYGMFRNTVVTRVARENATTPLAIGSGAKVAVSDPIVFFFH